MRDIYLAIAGVGLLSILIFWAALRLTRSLSSRITALLAVLALSSLLAFNALLWDNLRLTRLLPFSNVVIVGNWQPLAVALLAGLAWRSMPGSARRKSVLVVPLVLIGAYKWTAPLLATPPRLQDRWSQGVCLQTSQASCSAAAAATLLRAHGIDADEPEMARLCLTGPAGTTMHGLYRGLRLKTQQTPWDVQFFSCDLADLRDRCAGGPVMLSVRLDDKPGVDPRYKNDWHWTPGVSHTVVLFGFDEGHDDRVIIGDPSVGREFWSTENLHVLWHGEGLRFVRRGAS